MSATMPSALRGVLQAAISEGGQEQPQASLIEDRVSARPGEKPLEHL